MTSTAWREVASPIAPPPGAAAHAIAWGTENEELFAALVACRSQAFPDALAKAVLKRRIEFAAGRLCAALALDKLGVAPCPLAANADRSVAWPAGTVGSITHAHGFAWAVVARGPRGIGIDSESIARGLRAADEVRDQVLTPDESSLLDVLGLDPKLSTLLAFSAKEAVFKALAPTVGRFFGFDAFRIEKAEKTRLIGRVTHDFNSSVNSRLTLSIEVNIDPIRLNSLLLFQ
jgi:enterobactin synthetase component D